MMKKLKLFFACLLMAVLSIGQMWGASPDNYSFSSFTSAATVNLTTTDGFGITLAKNAGSSNPAWSSSQARVYAKGSLTIDVPAASDYKITSITYTYVVNKNKSGVAPTIDGVSGTGDAGSWNSSTKTWTASSTGATSVAFTTSGTAGNVGFTAVSITYTTSGSSTPTPTVSADPEEVENVAFAGVTDQTIDLTYENITDYETEVSVHPNADGTGTLSPAWLTASVTDADDYATVTYSVAANTGAARTAYIKVYTTDGDKEAETIIPVSQVKYTAPTGTFELFSGDIEEGDYLIVADGAGMNTTVSGNRLQYTALTLTGENYVNPDESVIWHIAESATAGYWTIYSGAESKYAAATGSNNQAQMLESGTDNKSLWEITHSEAVYTITNKSNSRFLKKNGTYGFACYADGTVSLYKKQVAGQPATPTFSVAGGNYESAQSVEISCATVGATIHYTLDGTKPTSSSPTYSTALNISSTTTVKAVAIKDDVESTVATATYTIVVWQTVDEIWSSITSEGPTNANVWGYVSQANVGGYNNNYYISVDGSLTANQLEIYKGDNAGNTVAVGDKVHVNGDLTIFNEIKEFKQNTGVIVHYAAKGALQSVAVSGTPTKTEYASGEDFEPAGLKVFGTYANGFVGEITEGITWGNDLTGGKVTESTTVHVTATVSGITNDPAYDVPVTVAAKTLVSIAVGTASYTIYTGEALPQPVVTATFSEGEPEDVSAFAVYDSESVFDTEVIDNPDPQTITVSYTFGGATQTATYTVSVKDYANDVDHPYTVAEAIYIITNAIGTTASARDIYVQGIVCQKSNPSSNSQTYYISDDGTTTNKLEIYKGKYFDGGNFTTANQVLVNDEVVVGGKVKMFNTQAEFDTGSELQSLARTPNFEINNVASFEVGTADLAVADLTITVEGEGAITFANSDNTDAVTIVEGKLHAVAAGTATITANLAQNGIYKAATAEFNVTVIPATVKYAITFDGNGADGGTAPDAIADKAAGAEVTLPANSYTKTGYTFTGWKVYDENEDEVTVTAGAFTMPASPVTIKAQWAEIPVWAYTYTSNVTLTTTGGTSASEAKVVYSETQYDAIKAGTGSVYGAVKVTVPAGASKLHYHAYGWNGETVTLNITAPTGVTVAPTSQAINSNTGISSNSPFTLADADPKTDAYYAVALSGNTEETTLTFTATGGKRFVLFGVNQEGGVVPELDHITITGELTNKDYELGDELDKTGLTVTAHYTLAGAAHHDEDVTSDVVWSNDPLTGGQTSVDVTATYGGKSDTKACDINAVVVPTPEIILSESALEFSGKQYGAVANKTFNVTLKNVAAATVALSGDDAAKFSIDPAALTANGTVTVSVANTNVAGSFSATITVSDDVHAATSQTVALTLTITADEAPASTTAEWIEATEIYDGMPVLITGVNTTTSKIYAMGAQNDNNRAAVEATLNGDVLTPGNGTKAFTLVKQDDDTYAIMTSDGKYLYAASSSKNYLRTQTDVDADAKWTLSVTSASAESSNNRHIMQFNTSSVIFSCYESASQAPIKLYTPKTYTRTVSGNYGTICLPKAGVMTNGVLYEISYYDADQKKIFFDEVEGGVMVAGAPYIFKPNENVTELKVAYTDVAVVDNAGHKNGLYGHYDLNNPTEGAEAARLFLTNGDYFLRNNEYWKVDQVNRVYVDNYRAYIKLNKIGNDVPPQAYGRRRVAMNVNGEQVATGFENLNASEKPVKLMIDGNIYILRGEKLYDTTGRLVK